ncbi:MAG: response regulator transcription factor [Vicinamibacterales bacterium]
MRVLLVEDEQKLAGLIRKGLAEEKYIVEIAADGETALDLARSAAYDIVILDIMLPGIDGFAVCEEIRRRHREVPILMLSARGMIEDRVRGLDTGADDYLTKPFAFSELSARVRALLRRQTTAAFLPLTVGDLTLDPVRRLVTRRGRRVDLTQKELALLEYLMRNAGQVLTRAMIAEQVWDVTWDRLTNVIDVFINHLRKKLEEPGEPRLIHAVRGVGYVMRSEEGGPIA